MHVIVFCFHSSAGAERAFSLMNLILTKLRTRLSSKTLDVLMRLRYYPADIKTLDINRITFKFLLRHRSCRDNLGGVKNTNENQNEVENQNGEDVEIGSDFSDSESESSDGETDISESETDMSESEDDSSENEEEYRYRMSLLHHDYAHTNRQRRMEREPFEELFEIINVWEGNALTAIDDDTIKTQEGEVGDSNRKWFKSGQFLVNNNGKVLQDNGPDEWVTLEYPDPAKRGQKWTLRIVDREYNQEIKSGIGNCLEIIRDPRESDVLRIGTKSQHRRGWLRHSSLWKINSLGEVGEIGHHDEEMDQNEE